MKGLKLGLHAAAAALCLSAIAGAAAPASAEEALTPSRIYVKYRPNTKAVTEATAASLANELGKSAGVAVLGYEKRQDALILTAPKQEGKGALQAVADRIASNNPDIEYAEAERIAKADEVNDPLFQRQWDLYEAKVGVDAPAAWGGSTGRGVIVAVVDTGIRPHPDLIKKTLPGYNFVTKRTLEEGRKPDGTDPGDWCPLTNGDSTWHGTHVAGTIAAETNNGLGIAGIAPDAKIVPVRVLGHCGGSTLDIADGILWAAGLPVGDGSPLNPNPAKVINMSLGGDGACGARYADVIRQARAKGVTIVVAAGNSNDDVAGHTPANCEGVIAVAATTRTGARASYSNFGGLVKIAAPGGETQPSAENGILSTLNRGKQAPGEDVYAYYQGTSMASPHVAGIVALAVQLRPGISPDEVLQVLQNSAQPFPSVSENQCSVGVCGAGIANAAAVVQTLSSKSAAVKTQAAPVPVNAQAAPAPVKSAAAATPLAGQWLLGDSGAILDIPDGVRWLHPVHGSAKIRPADDTADIKVYYEGGSTRCSYRISFADGGKTLQLVAADRSQDPDWCPEGSLKRVGG
ncbi:MAG: S8 family peptidase [Rhodomicrobium sp.]